MPEIADHAEFTMPCDNATFVTRANGDKLTLVHLALVPAEGASLAWLVNQPSGTVLKVEITLDA